MWKKFKEMPIVYPVVVMFIICLVITAALAGTNALTKDQITKINKENEEKAMKELIVADEYKEGKVTVDKEECKYNEAVKDGKTVGYIIQTSEYGYGGEDKVMVAVDTEGKIIAIKVLDVSNETPGLGQNTAKDGFTKQFKGKSGELSAVKNGTAKADNEIDAVASATISSKAVTRAVNRALKIYGTINTEPEEEPAEQEVSSPEMLY